jgi:hypothetical protein
LWNGVEFEAAFAPQIVRLSGIVVDDDDIDLPASLKKTVLMSRMIDEKYELDRFEGPNESIAIYTYSGGGD